MTVAEGSCDWNKHGGGQDEKLQDKNGVQILREGIDLQK